MLQRRKIVVYKDLKCIKDRVRVTLRDMRGDLLPTLDSVAELHNGQMWATGRPIPGKVTPVMNWISKAAQLLIVHQRKGLKMLM